MSEIRTIDVLDLKGKKAGTVDLPAEVFDVETNIPLMHQVVVAQLAAGRQGTHATKTRGMVSGGGKKPFRQKGTGNARQGSIRAPHFTGGGIVHGPQPRDYSQRTPKKMKVGALRSALSDRARNGRIHVVTALFEGEKHWPRFAHSLLTVRHLSCSSAAMSFRLCRSATLARFTCCGQISSTPMTSSTTKMSSSPRAPLRHSLAPRRKRSELDRSR